MAAAEPNEERSGRQSMIDANMLPVVTAHAYARNVWIGPGRDLIVTVGMQ